MNTVDTQHIHYGTSDSPSKPVCIKIIGVGGAGAQITNRLQASIFDFVDRLAIDTDVRQLSEIQSIPKLTIGTDVTRGLSTGGETELGYLAADQARYHIKAALEGVNLLFLIGGLGGGCASGALPVISEIAAELKILTLSCITMPFGLEGKRKQQLAEVSLQKLYTYCDGVIVLPNDILFQQVPSNLPLTEAFILADAWITYAIRSICTLTLKTGMLNLDLATLQTVLSGANGKLLFSFGSGSGALAIEKIIQSLETCPFQHTAFPISQADRMLINIVSGTDLCLEAFNQLTTHITTKFKSHQQVFIGLAIEPLLGAMIEVCVIGAYNWQPLKTFNAKFNNKKSLIDYSSITYAATAQAPSSIPPPAKFVHLEPLRGYFDQTDTTDLEGIDLDIPTFIRKGIRIDLKQN